MNNFNPEQQNIIYNQEIHQPIQTHQQIFNFQQVYYPQQQMNYQRNNNSQYVAQVVKKSGNQIFPIDVEARFNGNEQEGQIDFLFGYIANASEIFCNYRVDGGFPVNLPKPPPNYRYGYDDNNSFDQAYEDYQGKLLLACMKQIQQSMQLDFTGITYEQKTNLLSSNFVENNITQILVHKNTMYTKDQIENGQVVQCCKTLHQSLLRNTKRILFHYILALVLFCTFYALIFVYLVKNGKGSDFNRFLAIFIVTTVIHLLGLRQILSCLINCNLSGFKLVQCFGFLQIIGHLVIFFLATIISVKNTDSGRQKTLLSLSLIGIITSFIPTILYTSRISYITNILQRFGCLLQQYPEHFLK
ncbi:transmembrane protein, putative (macronuclear) [Tetrahymena thermophila SB210]|uniref:Transmembrane protein, putative n=1 Tax=Tetrahymena thermophila (strain SB210) TaxID=312017 RepID=I7LZK2_TETTS|nr:transmembrane protein, putative [Tetrahymena thermophila SB210]EAR84088.2 transmembrane protein, putative [Tetrahymena thermophila SB210]|eukprot:XP_001031751.2 transmembrane protein, putative [Tetrahymena thermophila SB210]